MITSRGQTRLGACCAAVSFLMLAGVAQAKVYTIEEAVTISETTGRPIFAVGGSKT